MQLGDLGADVIKVERPGAGDDTRQWGPPFAGGESAYYLCCNRNKRSLTVNLKTPVGRDLVARLADRADVLVENFLPGTLDGWGLSYAELSRRNPRLVYCSITGFGQTGPLRDEPGYDIMIQALGGVMSITGEPDGPPLKVGVAISDITAGMCAVQAILAALFACERSGKGDRIDISLFDATLSWLANVGSNCLVTGQVPKRYGNAHPNIVPYQSFEAAEGTLIIAVGNDAQFQKFSEILGQAEWATDPRFQTNAARVRHREILLPRIQQIIANRPAAEWLQRFAQAGIPASPVQTVDRALAEPQAAAREMIWTVAHPTAGPLKFVGSPMKLAGQPPFPRQPPPLLGEHTEEVLKDWLGMSSEDVAALRQQKSL
jgi:formyl-CoA transferase